MRDGLRRASFSDNCSRVALAQVQGLNPGLRY